VPSRYFRRHRPLVRGRAQGGVLTVFRSTGRTAPPPAQTLAVGALGPLTSGDFNGDGKPDVVSKHIVLINHDGALDLASRFVFFGAGDGTFSGAAGAPFVNAQAIGDFDGDGNLDVAFGITGQAGAHHRLRHCTVLGAIRSFFVLSKLQSERSEGMSSLRGTDMMNRL
jgi:hypothetical protein